MAAERGRVWAVVEVLPGPVAGATPGRMWVEAVPGPAFRM